MPNYNKARSAQSYANQLKNDKDTYGWQFKAIIGDPIEGTMARSLTITTGIVWTGSYWRRRSSRRWRRWRSSTMRSEERWVTDEVCASMSAC